MSNRPTRFYSALSCGWSSSAGPALSDTNRSPGDPSGWTQGYFLGVHSGTHPVGYDIGAGGAMTGDSQALRARAENRVASMTGQLRGAQFQARNFADSSGGSMHAFTAEAIAGGFTLGTLRGAEIIADNTTGTGTITTMTGLRIRVIGAGTVTNGPFGLEIINDSATALAAAKPLTAAIRIIDSATSTIGALIDASGQQTTIHDSDQVTLFKFKNAGGTTVTCSYDTSAGGFVFA